MTMKEIIEKVASLAGGGRRVDEEMSSPKKGLIEIGATRHEIRTSPAMGWRTLHAPRATSNATAKYANHAKTDRSTTRITQYAMRNTRHGFWNNEWHESHE